MGVIKIPNNSLKEFLTWGQYVTGRTEIQATILKTVLLIPHHPRSNC